MFHGHQRILTFDPSVVNETYALAIASFSLATEKNLLRAIY